MEVAPRQALPLMFDVFIAPLSASPTIHPELRPPELSAAPARHSLLSWVPRFPPLGSSLCYVMLLCYDGTRRSSEVLALERARAVVVPKRRKPCVFGSIDSLGRYGGE